MPEIEEAEDARVVFEERIGMMRDLCKAIDGLFVSFLKMRAGSSWESATSAIRRWIMHPGKQVAA